MGGAVSIAQSASDELIGCVLPIYCVEDAIVGPLDQAIVDISWGHIIHSTSPEFIRRLQDKSICYTCCSIWFHTEFYDRFFETCGESRNLFEKPISVQGDALINMISKALSLFVDQYKLVETLTALAKFHTTKGVLASQYGPMGEVLFWTLELCLGNAFDEMTRKAWIKIYSIMLKIILPVVIEEDKAASRKHKAPLISAIPGAHALQDEGWRSTPGAGTGAGAERVNKLGYACGSIAHHTGTPPQIIRKHINNNNNNNTALCTSSSSSLTHTTAWNNEATVTTDDDQHLHMSRLSYEAVEDIDDNS